MNSLPELEGFWWCPEDQGVRLAGRVFPDTDSARLHLTIQSPDRSLFARHPSRDYAVIHGETADGRRVSLLKCFDLNSHRTMAGLEKRIVLANYVLIGGHVPEEPDCFSELVLKWSSLKRWFFTSGVQVDWGEGEPISFTITYKSQEMIRVRYADDVDIEIAFGPDCVPSDGPLSEEISFKEVVWVTVRPSRKRDFEYYLSVLEELRNFFTICNLEYSYPEEISLWIKDSAETDDGRTNERMTQFRVHLASSRAPSSSRLPHPREMLLPFGPIDGQFPKVLASWHALAGEIQPVRTLYTSALYGQNRYIESTFLSLAQAAEVFHRRLYDGTYLPSEEFESNVGSSLRNAIPSNLDSDVRTAFLQRIEYFNEYSLSKRLKDMASNHPKVFAEYAGDWKKKIRGIVSARNYFTHYSRKSGGKPPDINDLVEYREFLRMLIELEMLRCCGVDESTISTQALNCERYRLVFSSKSDR